MGTERLYRSRTDRMCCGVSGGLGHYFGIDPTIVRLFWVLAAIFSGGLAVLAYLALWILVPEEPYPYGTTPPYGSYGSSFSSTPFSAPASTGVASEGGATTESTGAASENPREPSGVGSGGVFGDSGPFAGTGSASEPGSYGSTGPFGSAGQFGPTGSYSPMDRFGAYPPDERRRRRSSGAGWALVVLGAIVLASNLHLLSWISLGVVWPVFLIGLGVFLLYRHGYLH